MSLNDSPYHSLDRHEWLVFILHKLYYFIILQHTISWILSTLLLEQRSIYFHKCFKQPLYRIYISWIEVYWLTFDILRQSNVWASLRDIEDKNIAIECTWNTRYIHHTWLLYVQYRHRMHLEPKVHLKHMTITRYCRVSGNFDKVAFMRIILILDTHHLPCRKTQFCYFKCRSCRRNVWAEFSKKSIRLNVFCAFTFTQKD